MDANSWAARLSSASKRYQSVLQPRSVPWWNQFWQNKLIFCDNTLLRRSSSKVFQAIVEPIFKVLVSVSCAADLENMMDEYEKLTKRSSNGSAKLRIFLFSPLELETASLGHIGDVQDGGQRYVEVVNGLMVGGDPITRNESIDSTFSAQNSDVSDTEGTDSLSHGLGEVTGPPSSGGGLSHKGNRVSFETTPRMVYLGVHVKLLLVIVQ